MIQEAYVFLSAMGTGLITGFLYDLFRLKRKALKTRGLMVTLEDVFFWIITAVLVFITAYISNQGEIRLYFFLAMLSGVVIYYSFLSFWVTQILTFIVKIIIWPFAFLIQLFKPPVMRILRFIGGKAQKTKNGLHQVRTKANLRFKSVGKIMRKV